MESQAKNGASSPTDCTTEDIFNKAAQHLTKIASNIPQDKLLYFYAHYKQSTEGPCVTSKPSMFQVTAKRKWEAWKSLGDMDKTEAMERYIIALHEVDSSWIPEHTQENFSSWARVSRMEEPDKIVTESEDVFLDAVKEGNLDILQTLDVETYNSITYEDGMTALHWAADRGHPKIVQYLLDNSFRVDSRDSSKQTALHYAASCGHADVVKVLLKNSANKLAEDEDCLIARDIATDSAIIDLLD